MSPIRQITLFFLFLVILENAYSQGTTTLTINSPTPVAVYSARDLVRVEPGANGAKLTAGATTTTQLVIDKNIIASISTSNPYVGYSVSSVYNIDKNLPVGAVNGSGGVSSGQSYYSVPIPIAPGTAGMVPNISISYNGSLSSGLVGVGWGISGISSISRVKKDPNHNAPITPISLTTADDFALDGNRIWGANLDGTFRLENDDFTDVIKGTNSFTVITKAGIQMEYGVNADAKLMVDGPSGQVPLVYYINKVTDKNGNYYTYHYYNYNNLATKEVEVAIQEIKYTGNVAAGVPLYNSVKFYYDTRDDVSASYFKGYNLRSTLILREIEVFCEGQSIKRMVPGYDKTNGRTYLSSITEYGLDNSHLNPTVFAYEPPVASTNINVTQLPALADYKVADFNGDGKSDVLAYIYSGPIATGSGLRNYSSWELYINQDDGTTYSLVDSYSGTGNFQAYSYYGIPNTFSPDADGTNSINLDGDDKEDALFLTSVGGLTSYTVQNSTGTGFAQGWVLPNIPTAGASMLFADLDGDKIPEGLAYDPSANVLRIINFRTKKIVHRVLSGALFTDKDPAFATGSVVGNMQIIQPIEYDGDGIQELLVEINSKWRVIKVTNYSPYQPSGTGNFAFDVLATDVIYSLLTAGCYSYENHFADFNGDGLTDNLTVGTDPTAETIPPSACPLSVPNNFFLRYGVNKYISANSSFYSTSTPMAGNLPGRNNIGTKMLYADMDNDGKTDLVAVERNLSANTVKVYVSYAPNFSTRILIGTVANTTFPNAINYNYYTLTAYPADGRYIAEFCLGDFDGDGFTDVMFKNVNVVSGSSYYNGARTILYNHPPGTEGHLAKVTNGFDQSIKFNYKTLAKGGIYTKGNGAIYPFVDIQNPIKVVSSMESQDANGNFYSMDYTYQGAKINHFGQGFLGYDRVSTVNNLAQTLTTNAYSIDTLVSRYQYPAGIWGGARALTAAYAYRTHTLSETSMLSNVNLPIAQTINTYSYVYSNGLSLGPALTVNNTTTGVGHYLKLLQTFNLNNITGSFSLTDYTYDNYLNVTNAHTQSTGGLVVDVLNTMDSQLYGNKYPGYIFTTKTDVTRTGKPTVSRTDAFTYFITGLVHSTAKYLHKGCTEITNYIYNNSVGLPTSVEKDKGSVGTGYTRFTYYDYEPNRYRFVTKTTNHMNHFETAVYDPRFGVPLQTTDITNLTTNYTYDAYGQNTSVTTPDNNTVNYITKWYDSGDDIGGDPFAASNILITKQVNAPNTPFERSFFTASGLNVKNVTQGFNQNFVSNRNIFNNRGQATEEKAPYLIPCAAPAKVLTSTYSYNDPYFRLTDHSVTDDGTTAAQNTNIAYSQMYGNTTTILTTPDGKVKTTVTDPIGLVTSVQENPGGTALTYDYYSDGQIKTTSLDGIVTNNYTYDDCGNIASQDEPNNGITIYSVDGYGQLVSRTNDSKTYNYQYDELGRPKNFSGPEGTYLYTYITTGAGLGNIETETAPNGTMTKYYYDALNRQNKIEETIGSTYSTLIDYDNFSNPVKYTYPSGFAIKLAYDNLGYPTSIKNNSNNNLIWQADEINSLGVYNKYTLGNGIQTVNTYHNFGMPETSTAGSIVDDEYNFDVPTGNLMWQKDHVKNLLETHQYDGFDRLINSQVTNLNTMVNLPALALTYAANGNISSKSDLGLYKYVTPNKPNAVTKVQDPNGIISTLQQDITYTAFEKAETIIEGTVQADITYGPGQERMRTVFKTYPSGAVTSTRYYLSNYDKEVSTGMTREVHYINAPSGLAAMYVVENGVANMYFTYSDHLGTAKRITNTAGSVVAEQNFDPWGQRRNTTFWSYSHVASPPAWLFRGYTGHEHLPQFTLINMNGRMYDPRNARMLSPDPVLQDASSSQTYNRYSYCINNPLKYTDPSGYTAQGASSNDVDLSINKHLWNNPNHGALSAQEEALYYYNQTKNNSGSRDGLSAQYDSYGAEKQEKIDAIKNGELSFLYLRRTSTTSQAMLDYGPIQDIERWQTMHMSESIAMVGGGDLPFAAQVRQFDYNLRTSIGKALSFLTPVDNTMAKQNGAVHTTFKVIQTLNPASGFANGINYAFGNGTDVLGNKQSAGGAAVGFGLSLLPLAGSLKLTGVINYAKAYTYSSKTFGYSSTLFGIGSKGYFNGLLNRGPIRVGWGYIKATNQHVFRFGIGHNPRFYPNPFKVFGIAVPHSHLNLFTLPATF
ncbi:MAG: RHS repeat-associated core domain-containing protein [Bacteroidota bacterium]